MKLCYRGRGRPQIAVAYDSGKMPPLLGYDGASP